MNLSEMQKIANKLKIIYGDNIRNVDSFDKHYAITMKEIENKPFHADLVYVTNDDTIIMYDGRIIKVYNGEHVGNKRCYELEIGDSRILTVHIASVGYDKVIVVNEREDKHFENSIIIGLIYEFDCTEGIKLKVTGALIRTEIEDGTYKYYEVYESDIYETKVYRTYYDSNIGTAELINTIKVDDRARIENSVVQLFGNVMNCIKFGDWLLVMENSMSGYAVNVNVSRNIAKNNIEVGNKKTYNTVYCSDKFGYYGNLFEVTEDGEVVSFMIKAGYEIPLKYKNNKFLLSYRSGNVPRQAILQKLKTIEPGIFRFYKTGMESVPGGCKKDDIEIQKVYFNSNVSSAYISLVKRQG